MIEKVKRWKIKLKNPHKIKTISGKKCKVNKSIFLCASKGLIYYSGGIPIQVVAGWNLYSIFRFLFQEFGIKKISFYYTKRKKWIKLDKKLIKKISYKPIKG